MTIVLCSKGYPGKYKKNKIIKNLDKIKLSKNDFIYHAGTKSVGNNLFSIGGRVLNITSVGQNFLKIRQNIVSIIKKIKWNNGFYRKDIGWKIINKNANY
jgi:phosphoribosylamine--glycine ligase